MLAFKFVAFICTHVLSSSNRSKNKQNAEFTVAAENLSLFPFTENTHQVVFDAMFGKLEVLKKELEPRAPDTSIVMSPDKKEAEGIRGKISTSFVNAISRVRKSSVTASLNPQAQYISLSEEGTTMEQKKDTNIDVIEISVGNVLPAMIRSLPNGDISIQIKVLQSVLMLLNSRFDNKTLQFYEK